MFSKKFLDEYQRMVLGYIHDKFPAHFNPKDRSYTTETHFRRYLTGSKSYRILETCNDNTRLNHNFNTIYKLSNECMDMVRTGEFDLMSDTDRPANIAHMLNYLGEFAANFHLQSNTGIGDGFSVPTTGAMVLCRVHAISAMGDCSDRWFYTFAEVKKLFSDPPMDGNLLRKTLLDKLLATFEWKRLTAEEYNKMFANSESRFLIPKKVVDQLV